MALLARRVSRAKWDPAEGLNAHEVPADAVTADLRTDANALSFWRCDSSSEEDLRTVALALAAAAERVDKLDLVWLARAALEGQGITLRDSDGWTPVAEMVKRHLDAIHLDLSRLSGVAEEVAGALRAGQHLRLTRKEVVDLLAEAAVAKLVDLAALEEKVRTDVEKALATRDK